VPITPIAAGVLAFLVVLLWPSDTIASGAEERRKLDDDERRRPAMEAGHEGSGSRSWLPRCVELGDAAAHLGQRGLRDAERSREVAH
jgi:hypothetical protein